MDIKGKLTAESQRDIEQKRKQVRGDDNIEMTDSKKHR